MNARESISSQLRANQVAMILAARRHEGTKALYDAAAFAGDGETTQKYREELHVSLDEMLDLSASAMTLTRQLMELPG